MSFLAQLGSAAGPLWKVKTPFTRNKAPELTPLENAVVETQLAAALYDEATNTLHVLDQSKESKRYTKELRSILEVRRPARHLRAAARREAPARLRRAPVTALRAGVDA